MYVHIQQAHSELQWQHEYKEKTESKQEHSWNRKKRRGRNKLQIISIKSQS